MGYTVKLDSETEAIASRLVAEGRFETIDEAVRQAIAMLETACRSTEFDAAIDEGLMDFDPNACIDADVAFSNMFSEIEKHLGPLR